MQNLLILYNPYYQKDVIEQHIDILLGHDSQTFATVAFGKIRSKLRDYDHPYREKLQEIYNSASEKNYLQLFLTDYSSVYVAKVIEVLSDNCLNMAPPYYEEKNLDVENWFIISDMRRIVHNDFEQVRDNILSNFTTPNFDDHHYAIYGNTYVYPLVVNMENSIDYFENDNEDFRYFTEIFKNEKSLKTKGSLIDYRFGEKTFYALHPNTQDALVSAEIEFHENKLDPLYDFSAVIIKYSKAFEKELYLFMRELFTKLITLNPSLENVPYTVQGRGFKLSDYLKYKPNMGTNNFLLKNNEVKRSVNEHLAVGVLRYFIFSEIPKAIYLVQSIRNESVHGEAASLENCVAMRKTVVGIGINGIISDLIINKGNLS